MKKLVILFTFFVFSTQIFAQNADINLLKNINVNRNKSLDPMFRLITNSVSPLSIAVPAGLITNAFIQKDSISKSNAVIVSSSMILSGIISTTLKHTINRTRPFVTYPFIEKESSGGSASFPSGHTSSAFALATSVSIIYPKWYVVAPSFLWAGAVGYSRMHLGVHYPSDVFAGAVVGSGSAYLSYKLNQWYFKRWLSKKRSKNQ